MRTIERAIRAKTCDPRPTHVGAAGTSRSAGAARSRPRTSPFMRITLLAAALLLAPPLHAQGAPAAAPGGERSTSPPAAPSRVDPRPWAQVVSPMQATRGEMITITGDFPRDAAIEILFVRQATAVADSLQPLPAPQPWTRVREVVVRDSGKTLQFVIPVEARFDTYQLSALFGRGAEQADSIALPGPFQVVNRTAVKLNAVVPAVGFPGDSMQASLVADGLSPFADENRVLVNGRLIPACATGPAAGACIRQEVLPDGHTLHLTALPRSIFRGPVKVRLRVGEQLSDELPFTISRVNERTPLLYALLMLALLGTVVGLMLRPLTRGMRRGTGLLRAAFLDTATNTYSLSKLQFYLWTAAALLGYTYLTISRSLVQGDFTLPDVPRNLPGILLITAGTSVLAVGITGARGSKGAGGMHPSAADFLTTGGVVAPERLQFFVWTVIGVGAFLLLTLFTSPARIDTLPSVPEGFLYLMGISSAGYLGGKLARPPGPVLNRVEAVMGSLEVRLEGTHLSPDATLQIDTTELLARMLDAEKNPNGRPAVAVADEQAGFARALELYVTIMPDEWARPEWLAREHTFTIINPDGQKAVLPFQVTSPTTLPTGQAGGPMTTTATTDATTSGDASGSLPAASDTR